MKRFTSALLALALVVIPAGIHAQDTEWNRYTLEGLGGVYITATADADCEIVGVMANQVQADAAIKLLESEVDVLTREEMLENPGLPELKITVECVIGERGDVEDNVAYAVSVRVNQATKMIRDEQVTLPEAVTWFTTAVGLSEEDDARDDLVELIDVKLTEFATAYEEANAEEGGPGD